MKLTKERRDELKALAEKATKGPWATRKSKKPCRCPLCDGEGEVDFADIDGDGWFALARTYGVGPMIEDNAAFIKASRQAIPDALADIEELEAKLAEAVKALEGVTLELNDGCNSLDTTVSARRVEAFIDAALAKVRA